MDQTPRHFRNPFYVLLVLAGILFTVTACAYGVMMVRKLDPARNAERRAELGAEASGASRLVEFMDEHGFSLLMVELVVLGVATVAAMGTDEYWSRREDARQLGDVESGGPQG